MIKPVISKMFQTYAAATQRVSKYSFNDKRETVSFGQQPDVVEFHNSMGLTEDEVKRRRNALTEYIISGMDTDNVKLGNIPSFKELLNKPAGEIIDSCGDDLAKINKLTGHYGLVKYAAVPPKEIISSPNPDIWEIGYRYNDETLDNSFEDYLIHNPKGKLEDLYKRYGECGKIMCKEYSNPPLGYLIQEKGTYTVTPRFWSANGTNVNLCHMR